MFRDVLRLAAFLRCGCPLLIALVAPLEPAWAQSGPDPSSELLRQQERLQQQSRELRPQSDVRLQPEVAEPAARLVSGESPCFTFHSIHIDADSDATRQAFAWVAQALDGPRGEDSPLGRCLGSQGIAMIVRRAQDALTARGFTTSRVFARPQDVSAGTLSLTVVPGRLRGIRLEGPAPSVAAPRVALWNNLAARMGQPLDLRDIEQTLENLKRVPTAEANIRIEPADAPDQSDLVVAYSQALPARLAVSVDDSGGKATGRYQGSVTLSLDNLLSLSDLIYVTINNDLGGGDPGSRGTRGHVAHYSMPLGYWSLGATVSANRYYLSVAGSNQTYIYRGTSETAELSLARVVRRDSASKTTVTVKAFQRRSNNYIDDTEILTQRRVVGGYELALGYRRTLQALTNGRTGGGEGSASSGDTARFQANLSYRRGTGDFDTLPAPEESSGEGTSRFGLLLLEAGLDVPFKAFDQGWRCTSTLRVQNNTTPLTPQDRFAIGSRYSVRGFDGETLLSAERGWTVRNELILNRPHGQQLYLGLDYGEVGGPSSDTLVGKALAGAAIGWRGGWRKLQYDFFIGTPLHKPGNFKTAAATSGFVATWHL